ncbi:MAG: hypothetical protein R3B09_15745 [Nannocystaceae bacterium]
MSLRPRLALLLPVLALALAGGWNSPVSAAGADAKEESAAEPGALAGRWTFKGGESERGAVDTAIEASIQNLQGPLRDLARKRLQDTNSVPQAIVLEFEEEKRKVSLDRRTIRTRGDRTVLFTDPYGNTSRVTHRVDASALHERLITVDGERRNDFVVDSSGDRLTLSVRISSPHLARPVTYTLTYARE